MSRTVVQPEHWPYNGLKRAVCSVIDRCVRLGAMMSIGFQNFTPPTPQPRVVSEVAFLNAERRDQAFWLFARYAGRPVTQYDLVKFHVAADYLHFVEHGLAIMGGSLHAWPNGPVVAPTFVAVKNWAMHYGFFDTSSRSDCICPLKFVGAKPTRRSMIFEFVPVEGFAAEEDDFSPTENRSMHEAADLILKKLDCSTIEGWNLSQQYFHSEVSGIGYAWKKAKEREPDAERPKIDWYDLLYGAEKIDQKSVSYARAMLDLRS